MARDAAKATVKTNSLVIRAYAGGSAAVLLLYSLLGFLVLRRRLANHLVSSCVLLALHALLYAGIFRVLYRVSRPRYDSRGALLSPGADLAAGMWNYAYDVVYVTSAALLLSLWSRKFYLLDVLIPGYALLKGGQKFLNAASAASPFSDDPEEEQRGVSGAPGVARRARRKAAITVDAPDGTRRVLRVRSRGRGQ